MPAFHVPRTHPQGCVTATCATSVLVAFKPRHSLALLMQCVLTLHSWSSDALTALLSKSSASTDCCATQFDSNGLCLWIHTSLWPGNPTESRYDFKDHYLTCASAEKIQRSKSMYRESCVQPTAVWLKLHSELNKVKTTVTLMRTVFMSSKKKAWKGAVLSVGQNGHTELFTKISGR